jgi:hypothetical protein
MCHQLFLLFKLKFAIRYANMVENYDTAKNFFYFTYRPRIIIRLKNYELPVINYEL